RFANGYVALWGDGDLQLTQTGLHAGQELRSAGKSEVWVASMGSKAEDGDFRSFIERTKRFAPHVEDSALCATIDGDSVRFGWEGALIVYAEAVHWNNYPHYENAYTHTPWGAETMTLKYDDKALTLDLKNGRSS